MRRKEAMNEIIHDFEIRVNAHRNICGWGAENDGHYTALAALFGLSRTRLTAAMESDKELCQRMNRLNGPNGYVIYKMLKARMSE